MQEYYDRFHKAGLRVFNRVERAWNALAGERQNIFYWLGALPILFLVILLVTGLYMFLYYSMAIDTTYESVKYMTERAFGGRFMRSLHRYAAGAMMFFTILHMLRIFFEGKYQNHRKLSWITGVVILFFMLIQGVTGYIMPLDSTSRFVLDKTSEIISALGIFGNTLSRSFASPEFMGKWIMWVIFIVHLFIPFFFIVMIFIHVKRVSRARIIPPAALSAAVIIFLSVLSLVLPFGMEDPAVSYLLPYLNSIDWFYLFFAPLMVDSNALLVILSLFAVFFILFALPWLRKAPEIKSASLDLDKCTGCSLCSLDCPYEAIRMQPRTDGQKYKQEANVDTDSCAGCGICVASCEFDGMQLSGLGKEMIYHRIEQFTADRPGEVWIGFICNSLAESVDFGDEEAIGDIRFINLPCVGMMGLSLVDRTKELGARGVIAVGCPQGDCMYREGNVWTEARILNQRKPAFSHVDGDFPVIMLRNDRHDGKRLIGRIRALVDRLSSGKKLTRLVERIPLSPSVKNMAVAAFSLFFLISVYLLGASGKVGNIPLNESLSQFRVDFFLRTQPVSALKETLNEEDVQKELDRMTRSLKFDQMTDEARDRILNIARESAAIKNQSRSRLPFELIIIVDGDTLTEKRYHPSGLQKDGMVYVMEKIPLSPGIHSVTVKGFEKGKSGEVRKTYEFSMEREFLPGHIYYVDYDKHKDEIFIRGRQ